MRLVVGVAEALEGVGAAGLCAWDCKATEVPLADRDPVGVGEPVPLREAVDARVDVAEGVRVDVKETDGRCEALRVAVGERV